MSANLAHRVTKSYNSKAMSKKDMLVPGRIATVLFFPKNSLKILTGHEPGWGVRTNFGQASESALFSAVKRRRVAK